MGADADVIRRLTEEVFIGGNLDPIDELVADDYFDHDPPPGLAGTKEGFRQLAEMAPPRSPTGRRSSTSISTPVMAGLSRAGR